MASIQIKNVGPLIDTGQIDLGRFNVVIGKQSTGKSTFMKILCFCQWLEKKIMTGNDKELIYNFTHYSRFQKVLSQFHRFPKNYVSSQSVIIYQGEAITIYFDGSKNVKIYRKGEFEKVRHNTKLSFIPSERNLVSAIKNVDRAYKANDIDVLFNHIFEWGEARDHYTEDHPVDLSIVGDMDYYYDNKRGADTIRLKDKQQKISPFYASSGVQSILPIVVMIDYFTDPIFSEGVDLSKNDVMDWFRRFAESAKEELPSFTTIAEKVHKIYKYHNQKY